MIWKRLREQAVQWLASHGFAGLHWKAMSVHIAIPEPTSSDAAYNARSLPQYIAALQSVGATATVVPLHERQDRVARLLATVQGVLLPGSGFDVDPALYGHERISACAASDRARAAIDELLLQHAFNLAKPVLAICYGMQSLNVWRGGSLIQDLAAEGKTAVDHAPGRTVNEAHAVELESGSRVGDFADDGRAGRPGLVQLVNSSHHQALRDAGEGLRVTAVSPIDGVIEAVEFESANHFAVGVQWHPERTFTTSGFSRAIFGAFAHEAQAWKPRAMQETVSA